jgi:TonB family protein
LRTTTRAACSATPNKRRIAGAFGLAIGLHFAAIGVGFLDFQQPIETIGALSTGTVEVSMELTVALEEPVPPDVEPPVPVPTPVEEYLFTEAQQSPPPVPQNVSRPIAKVRRGTAGSHLSPSARALALSAPWPEYPPAARQNGITGDGVAMMTIDPSRGSVTHVSMWKSTGNRYLDDAALRSFRRWRFKPGSISRVKAPVTFRLTAQLE